MTTPTKVGTSLSAARAPLQVQRIGLLAFFSPGMRVNCDAWPLGRTSQRNLVVGRFVVLTPIAIIMRQVGRDPLKLRFDPEKPSYWLDRMSVGERQTSMTDQF